MSERPNRFRLVARSVEMITLFGIVPTGFWLWRVNEGDVARFLARFGLEDSRLARPGHLMLPTLAVFTLMCLLWLLFDRSFSKWRLWNTRGARSAAKGIALRFILGAIALTVITWQLQSGTMMRSALHDAGLPDAWLPAAGKLFSLPRENPGFWMIIMIFYPVVSVWPQEVVYRGFFFHRYRCILRAPVARIVGSAIAFGFMHIVFRNAVAPTLCVVGGLIFARTYERTCSVFAACIEHALYGCWVFTVGLGWYFYGGAAYG